MDCYTGPYWSNGKIQNSVEFGDCVPSDRTAYESRLHDTAFARYGDTRHRTAADKIYQQRLAMVPGIKPALVRNLPLYGNYLGAGKISGLLGPLSLLSVASSIYDVYDLEKRFKAGEYDSEIADVLKLYQEDPYNMGAALAPAVYPDDFAFGGPKLRGNRIQPETKTVGIDPAGNAVVSAAPPTVSSTDINNAVTVLGSENIQHLQDSEPDGTQTGTMAFNPYALYRPLRKKKQRITQREVNVYNKYHGTHYSLKEVLAMRNSEWMYF